jgi:hypothetical protein
MYRCPECDTPAQMHGNACPMPAIIPMARPYPLVNRQENPWWTPTAPQPRINVASGEDVFVNVDALMEREVSKGN